MTAAGAVVCSVVYSVESWRERWLIYNGIFGSMSWTSRWHGPDLNRPRQTREAETEWRSSTQKKRKSKEKKSKIKKESQQTGGDRRGEERRQKGNRKRNDDQSQALISECPHCSPFLVSSPPHSIPSHLLLWVRLCNSMLPFLFVFFCFWSCFPTWLPLLAWLWRP